jgi:hypothetical protein
MLHPDGHKANKWQGFCMIGTFFSRMVFDVASFVGKGAEDVGPLGC